MNNEEKILAILESVQAEQRTTNGRLDSMQAEQRTTNERLGNLEAGQAKLETKVDRIESEVSDIHREQTTMQRTLNAVKKVADATFEETGRFAEFQTQTRQDIEELRARQA